MDIALRILIRFAQLGRFEALELRDILVCLSCLICQVKCPRGINLPKLIDALRQIRLKEGTVKYTVFCKKLRTAFLNTPIFRILKKRLDDTEIKEGILNLCQLAGDHTL